MAVKTVAEIMEQINAQFGENTDDSVLTLIEDVSDTLNDYESRVSDSTDWRQRYEENDAQWRQRYKDRFFSVNNDEDDEEDFEEQEEIKPLTYENLFSTKE